MIYGYLPPQTAVVSFEAKGTDWRVMDWIFATVPPASSARWPVSFTVRQQFVNAAASFKKLKDGWLGKDSLGIPAETAQRVLDVAKTLEKIEGLPNPELTPNPNGTISLEWESARGEAYLEYGKTRLSAFVRFGDQPTRYIKDIDALPDSFFRDLKNQLYPPEQSFSITVHGAGTYSYVLPEIMESSSLVAENR